MAPKLIQFQCGYCRKQFNTYDPEKKHCSDKCEWKTEYHKKYGEGRPYIKEFREGKLYNCVHCGNETPNKKYCSGTCQRSDYNKINREETCKNSSKEFLRDKTPKHPKSPDELNRIAEWKRLNDNESWLKRFNGSRM